MPKSAPAAPIAAAPISREPQQDRSKASLKRMLKATQKVMEARGSEDFTLQEVSKAGRVSIGSIYLRFESKDNLVRAVIADHLERLISDETIMFEQIAQASPDLAAYVVNFVQGYVEFLRRHAPMIRLNMLRAQHDPLVSGSGRKAALRSARLAIEGMLAHADEFGGEDHELRAATAYDAIFSTLARHLALGTTDESADAVDWSVLKAQLARMCLAYLRHRDDAEGPQAKAGRLGKADPSVRLL